MKTRVKFSQQGKNYKVHYLEIAFKKYRYRIGLFSGFWKMSFRVAPRFWYSIFRRNYELGLVTWQYRFLWFAFAGQRFD